MRVYFYPSGESCQRRENKTDHHALLAIEAGSTLGWHRYVGTSGDILGVERFGASAPGEIVLREYGFTVENVIRKALTLLDRQKEIS